MADFITIIPQSTFNDTQKLLKDINAIADAVERVNKEAKEIKFPSEARKTIEKTNEGITKTNKLLTDTEVIRRRQQSSIRNVTVARSQENKEIQKNRVEAIQLNREKKEEAILNDKLIGAFRKLNLRRTQAAKTLQDLISSEKTSNREIRKAQREFDRLDKRVRRANKAVRDGRIDVGRYTLALGKARINALRFASALGFTGILFGIARGFQEAIRTIRDFDAQLIAVGKTTGLQGAELENLANKTIALGLELKGISIKGLLETAEVAGQLGIEGTDNILKFSQAVETLKSTSDVASEETVRAFAKFIGISKDSAINADRLASVITILGNNLKTTESNIIDVAIEVQKGLQLFNVSAESALGLAGSLSEMGVKSAAARTSLLKTFRVIQQSIFTGENLDTVLKLTNLSQQELADQFEQDATGVFLKFLKGLQTIEKQGGNVDAVLGELKLSGDRISPTISTMAVNFEKVSTAVGMANQEYIDNKAATEELDASTKSLNSIMGDLTDSWDAFILSIDKGDGVISKFIRGSAQGLTDFVNGLIDLNTTATEKGVNAADTIVQAFKTANQATTQETIAFIEKTITEAGNNIVTLQNRLAGIRTGIFQTSEDAKRIKQTEQAIKKEMALREQLQNLLFKEQETKAEVAQQTEEVIKTEEKSNNEKKKGIQATAGSVAAFKEQIKNLKELRDKTALTEAEFKSFNEQLSILEAMLLTITGIEGVDTGGLVSIEPEDIKLIEDAQEEMEEYAAKTEQAAKFTRELQNATDDFLNTFTEGVFADAGLESLKQFFDGTFDALIAGADTVQEKFAVTFNSIAEVAQEAFGFIEQIQAASIQKQLNDLNTQKEIELSLAEGNTEAIANINAQAAEQESQIKQKQAQQNKRNAIFNIAIDTAQAIIATLAATPPPAGIPLAIAVGAIGALQAALVAATPIPQFKDGVRDFEGGLAVVGDGGVPEVVTMPDKGMFVTPATPTLVNLPAGSDVYSNLRDFDANLNRILLSNRIEPVRSKSNSITADQMDAIFARNMRKMTALNLNIDQNGFGLSVQKGLAKTNIHKNRINFKGQKV